MIGSPMYGCVMMSPRLSYFPSQHKKKINGVFFGGGFGLCLISEIMEAWAYVEALPEGSWSGRHGVCD